MIASQRFPDAFQNLQKAMELFGAQFASNMVPVPPLNGPNEAANIPLHIYGSSNSDWFFKCNLNKTLKQGRF